MKIFFFIHCIFSSPPPSSTQKMFDLIFEGVGSYTITDVGVTLNGDDSGENIDVCEKEGKITFGRNTGTQISVGSSLIVNHIGSSRNTQQGNGNVMNQGIHMGSGRQVNHYSAGDMVNSIMGDNNKYNFGGALNSCVIGDNVVMSTSGKRPGEVSVQTGGSATVKIDGVKYKRITKDGKRILVPDEEEDKEKSSAFASTSSSSKEKEVTIRTYGVDFSQVDSVQVKGCCRVELDISVPAKRLRLEASGYGVIVSEMFILAKKVRATASGNGTIQCTWDTEDLQAQASGDSTISRFHVTDDGELRASGNANVTVTRDKRAKTSDHSSGNAGIRCAIGTAYVLA